MICRILNQRVGHFIIGFVSLVLVILMVVGNGLLLRDVWQSQINNKYDLKCSENMAPIHQDDIKEWCPNKYLPTGQTCRKQDATIKWEDSSRPAATLNPSCCFCVKNYYTWPYQMVGYIGIMFIICLGICAMTNIYLSDGESNYGLSKLAGPIDYGLLGLSLLALVVMLIYFWARKGDRSSGHNNASFRAYKDSDVNDPNFDRVNSKLLGSSSNEPTVASGNYIWDSTNPVPTFDSSSTTCSDESACVSRLAVLARNAKIVTGGTYSATSGGDNTRLQFFPGCTNSTNDYIIYFGKTENIASLMKSLQFTPKAGANQDPMAFYYIDQVSQSALSKTGLLSSETPSTTLTSSDMATCGTGFNIATNTSTCQGKCKYQYVQNINTTTLKGQLFYMNDNTKKTDIHSNVSVSAYKDGSILLGTGNLYSGGIYTIENIPVNPSSDTIYQVKVEDKSNVFLDDTFDVVVPQGAESETSAGHKRLLTKNGTICLSTNTDCINNQSLLKGTINVKVVNAETGNNVAGSTVTLRDGHT